MPFYDDDDDCKEAKKLTAQKKLVLLMNVTGALYEAGYRELATAVNAEASKIIGLK